MLDRPVPPFLPDTVEMFLENVNHDPEPWVEYLRKVDTFVSVNQNPDPALIEKLATQDTRITELEETVSSQKDQLTGHRGVIAFQRQESDRLNENSRIARTDRDRAVAHAAIPVSTPTLSTAEAIC